MKLLYILLLIIYLSPVLYSQQPKLQWQKTFGGDTLDIASSVIVTADSQFAFVGYAFSDNGDVTGHKGRGGDVWLVKFDHAGNLIWQKCLGGKGNELGIDLISTADGGYAALAYAWSTDGDVTAVRGNGDIWFVKLNAIGVIEWERCFGGTGPDAASSIIQTSDSGYMIAGSNRSTDGDVTGNHGGYDMWAVKLDSVGKIEWQKSVGGNTDDFANDIIETSDGHFVMVGRSDYDSCGMLSAKIAKLTSTGELVWCKCLIGGGYDNALSILETTGGGYAITGHASPGAAGNHGGSDAWFVMVNSDGEIEWQKCFGSHTDDQGSSIIQTASGDFVIAGEATSNDGDVTESFGYQDGWVICFDTLGTLKWQRSFGGSGEDRFYSLISPTPGEYVLAGSTRSTGITPEYHGRVDAWIVKLGPSSGVNDGQAIDLTISCVPNPAKTSTVVSYGFSEIARSTIISVSNASGVCLTQYDQGSLEVGNHETVVDLSGYTSGNYFITLTVNGLSKTCPIQIIK